MFSWIAGKNCTHCKTIVVKLKKNRTSATKNLAGMESGLIVASFRLDYNCKVLPLKISYYKLDNILFFDRHIKNLTVIVILVAVVKFEALYKFECMWLFTYTASIKTSCA